MYIYIYIHTCTYKTFRDQVGPCHIPAADLRLDRQHGGRGPGLWRDLH